MAETATYVWSSFDQDAARAGIRVGFRQDKDSDLSMTGILAEDRRYTTYKTVIDGKTLYINDLGVVIKSIPDDSSLVSKSVQMVTCEMKTTYGTSQAIPRGVTEGSEEVATLTSMEPRDQFAVYAMRAIMGKLIEPQSLDDANILFCCRAAYRWAQGMMIASADARAEKKKATESSGGDGSGGGSGESGSEEGQQSGTTTRSAVDTSSGTDTEKLLGNIAASVDDLTKQMKANSENLLKATLKTATAVDNATDSQDKAKEFKVEGAGGGGLDYDKLNDVSQNVSAFPVFNGKAAGRSSLANVIKKAVASLSDDDKAALYTALKPKMTADFDAKGSADQALTDAKSYTDTEIKKKHPDT